MAKRRRAAAFDVEEVRQAAAGRWVEILSSIGGIDVGFLDGQHHPCPKPSCGGTDRFRLIDADAGSLLCNKCFSERNGDGFSALQWFLGVKFPEALSLVAEHLGIEPTASTRRNGSSSNGQAKAKKAQPVKQTAKQPKKKTPGHPTLEEAVMSYAGWYQGKHAGLKYTGPCTIWTYQDAAGQDTYAVARLETDRGKHYCPLHLDGQEWRTGDPDDTKGRGATAKLPLFGLPHLADAKVVYIVEGEKAAEAAQEIGLVATTSAHGAGSARRSDWSPLAGKTVRIIPDNDSDGEEYAAEVAAILAQLEPPADVKIKRLPDLGPKGDIYDFVAMRWLDDFSNEEIYREIENLPAESIELEQQPRPAAIEADDDPHRLARINLERYASHANGATIRYWRNEWYTWKPSRGCYRRIEEEELRAKLSFSIKEEFDRINIERQQYDDGDELPKSQKVTKALVSNVLDATKSLALVPSSVELMTWLGKDGKRERRNYIAMRNGVLDLDRLLEDREGDTLEDVLQPHSPEWFSTNCLPYEFNPEATCPKWEAFLEKNLEMDPERIKILQEWAGYLLTPNTGEQKFLVLEGEGANGKSVYLAAIAGMLGTDNCSHVPLEQFGERFAKTQTIGKLVNICSDVGEVEKGPEGHLKAFTSGDCVFFDRKGTSGVECVPTARLMLAWNMRPRIADRTDGVWRRMMLIPFNVQIQKHERIKNMDKAWWWEKQGELPGIFIWAIAGLHRLQQQDQFTRSRLSETVSEEYRIESNPARAFLVENLEAGEGSVVRTAHVYRFYRKWSEENGYRPLGERMFGREIVRVFPSAERVKRGARGDRHWCYEGIQFTQDEICGERTADTSLF